MANLLSTLMTNTLAEPKFANDVRKQGGIPRVAIDSFEVPVTSLLNGDIWNLVRLPAGALIKSIKLAADDLDVNATETLAFDLGIYDTNGTVKSIDAFVDESALLENALVFTEVSFLNRAIEDVDTPLFELAGDTEDDHDAQYDIAITLKDDAETAQAGTVSFIIEYVDD